MPGDFGYRTNQDIQPKEIFASKNPWTSDENQRTQSRDHFQAEVRNRFPSFEQQQYPIRHRPTSNEQQANDRFQSNNLLPRFEVVNAPVSSNDCARQQLEQHFAKEMLTTRTLPADVRSYLIDQMNTGGPTALSESARRLNEVMTQMCKGLPEAAQLRLMYSVDRNPNTEDRYYSVKLVQHRNAYVYDSITFRAR